MHISICDDDEALVNHLFGMVSSFFRARGIEHTIECHTDADSFAESARKRMPDIALIDLKLGDADGYELARQLRASSVDTNIIFITALSQRMPAAFRFRPIGFLVKPVAEAALSEALDTALFYRWHEGLYYTVRVTGGEQRVPHKSILYFESDQHRVLIHTSGRGNSIVFTKRLDEVEVELTGLPYIRCHKSFIVQFGAIQALDRNAPCFVLATGGRVPISRRYYDRASGAFIRYKTR